VENNINGLRFYIKTDQKYVRQPQLNFVIHSGKYQDQLNNNDFAELTKVDFPIKLKAYYKQDYFELEIFQPGLWEIKTDITYIQGLNTQN